MQVEGPKAGVMQSLTPSSTPTMQSLPNVAVIAEVARQLTNGCPALMHNEGHGRCLLETEALGSAVPLHLALMASASGTRSSKIFVFYSSTVSGTRIIESVPLSSVLTFCLADDAVALCFARTSMAYALVTNVDAEILNLVEKELQQHAEFSFVFCDGSGSTVFSSLSNFRSQVVKHIISRRMVRISDVPAFRAAGGASPPSLTTFVDSVGADSVVQMAMSRSCGRAITWGAEVELKMRHPNASMGGAQFKQRVLFHTPGCMIFVKRTKLSTTPYLYVPWCIIAKLVVDTSSAASVAVLLETEPLVLEHIIIQFGSASTRRKWIEECSSVCATLFHSIAVDSGSAASVEDAAPLRAKQDSLATSLLVDELDAHSGAMRRFVASAIVSNVEALFFLLASIIGTNCVTGTIAADFLTSTTLLCGANGDAEKLLRRLIRAAVATEAHLAAASGPSVYLPFSRGSLSAAVVTKYVAQDMGPSVRAALASSSSSRASSPSFEWAINQVVSMVEAPASLQFVLKCTEGYCAKGYIADLIVANVVRPAIAAFLNSDAAIPDAGTPLWEPVVALCSKVKGAAEIDTTSLAGSESSEPGRLSRLTLDTLEGVGTRHMITGAKSLHSIIGCGGIAPLFPPTPEQESDTCLASFDIHAPKLRPLRRLYATVVHFAPAMLTRLLEAPLALDHAQRLQHFLRQRPSRLNKRDAAAQTVRLGVQDQHAQQAYQELLAQHLFEQEHEKRLMREVPELQLKVAALERQLAHHRQQSAEAEAALHAEISLRQDREHTIASHEEQIASMMAANHELREQLSAAREALPPVAAARHELLEQVVVVLVERELCRREQLMVAERADRFHHLSLLMWQLSKSHSSPPADAVLVMGM